MSAPETTETTETTGEPDLDDLDDDLEPDGSDEPGAADGSTAPRRRKPKTSNDPFKHPDGHNLIDGARWHYPKTGSPSECAVAGCERVLTRHLRGDIIDSIEAADEAGGQVDAADAAGAEA